MGSRQIEGGSCASLTTIREVQNPLSHITKLQIRGLQAIKEYLRPVEPRLDQDQDHEWDQGRLRENAVQSCEGAPREASGQEGTARGEKKRGIGSRQQPHHSSCGSPQRRCCSGISEPEAA